MLHFFCVITETTVSPQRNYGLFVHALSIVLALALFPNLLIQTYYLAFQNSKTGSHATPLEICLVMILFFII